MNRKDLIDLGIIGAVGGAIAALCLKHFTTLPALAIGGIIGAPLSVFAIAYHVSEALYNIYKGYHILQGHFLEGTQHQHNRDCFIGPGIMMLTSAAIGVGFTAALTSIYPEIFAKWNTAIVAGAVIGAIGSIGGWLAKEFFIKKPEREPDEELGQLLTEFRATLTSPNPRGVGGSQLT